jgi:hypothetical protein
MAKIAKYPILTTLLEMLLGTFSTFIWHVSVLASVCQRERERERERDL